jgi:ribosomal protein L29
VNDDLLISIICSFRKQLTETNARVEKLEKELTKLRVQYALDKEEK